MTQSFLFGGKKKPLTYEEMMRQRAVSQSLAQPMPTRNLGEGLSAIGRVIGSKMAGSRADKASTALRGDFEKEFQALLGGNMGGSAIQRAVQQRYSPQPTQQQPTAAKTKGKYTAPKPPKSGVRIKAPKTIVPIIEPTNDSNKSAPIPATPAPASSSTCVAESQGPFNSCTKV